MDILCLMGLFPKEYEKTVEKDTIKYMQIAANKLQWAIVRGLDAQEGVNVHICNSMYIGVYPKTYRKLRIPSFPFSHKVPGDGMNIGFITLPYIKIFSRYFSSKKYIKNWYKHSCSSSEKVFLVYALTTPFTWLAKYVSKNFPDVKVCIIVPDLPEYMDYGKMQKRGLYYFYKTAEISNIKKAIKNINYFVLLTDSMKSWFNKAISYTVVEGIANPDELDDTCKCSVENPVKHIVYAGGIKFEYGVGDLVSAFCCVEKADWVLDIYGDGPDLANIKALAGDNRNIFFHGPVANSIVVEKLKTADLLVNPRKNQELTAYSFPSKIIEYMSSGTPMLAYKLDGVPNEYDNYYFHIPDRDAGLIEALTQVMDMDRSFRREMGKKAKQFIIENKTPDVQCKKIVQLLEYGNV